MTRKFFVLLTLALALTLLIITACTEEPTPTSAPTFVPPSPTYTPTEQIIAEITPTPSFTPQPPTNTPTLTATPTETPNPTTTPQPTPLPTTTPTFTPVPTFTPGAIQSVNNYTLTTWTVDTAQTLINRLENYPNTLPAGSRGFNDIDYYNTYQYAALAQAEAILRFPNAPEADAWRWNRAYNLARSSANTTGTTYATLINTALLTGETTLPNLITWFSLHETRLTLSSLGLVEGTTSTLYQLSNGVSGLYLVVVDDPAGFQTYPLNSEQDFDFANGVSLDHRLEDATNDGIADLITLHAHQPGPDRAFYYTNLNIHDLSHPTPQRLTFAPPLNTHLGWGENDSWGVTDGDLVIRGLLSDRCSDVEQEQRYTWDGDRLQLSQTTTLINPDNTDDYRTCLTFIYPAAQQNHPDAIAYLQNLIATQLQFEDPDDDIPANEQIDEWRFRLGIYSALAFDTSQAAFHLTTVTTNPVDPASDWIRPAGTFHDTYQDPTDLYRACDTTDLCDNRLAITNLVATIPVSEFAIAETYFSDFGIPVVRSGFFDLDGDNATEQWVHVRNTSARVDLWILAHDGEQINAYFIETLTRNDFGFNLERLTPVQDQPIIRASTGFEDVLFVYAPPRVIQLRDESVGEASNYTPTLLTNSLSDLLASGDPAGILSTLLTFQDTRAYDCTLGLQDICPDILHLLALTYELTGDTALARDTYHQLWRDYPDHPYALIAQSKLTENP